METTDVLRRELLVLARALQAHGVPLILGGGYGLLLKQENILHSRVRTVRHIAQARATTDLDIFLSVELVVDATRMVALRQVLVDAGYTSVAGAEHYQFRRTVTHRGTSRTVKVDLLAPPPRDPGLLAKVRIDERRIRPRGTTGIHAHTTPEAFLVEEQAISLEFGEAPAIRVLIPHPYAFLLLKLYAYRDRRRDPAKELGIYHAFDLYRIIAMMSEDEYTTAEALRDRFKDDEVVREARRIVAELFASPDAPGSLAILDHARIVGAAVRNEDLAGFLEDLRIFFP